MIDIIVPENETKEKSKSYQRLVAYAVKACHIAGKTIEETCSLLELPYPEVESLYELIEDDLIDFSQVLTINT